MTGDAKAKLYMDYLFFEKNRSYTRTELSHTVVSRTESSRLAVPRTGLADMDPLVYVHSVYN